MAIRTKAARTLASEDGTTAAPVRNARARIRRQLRDYRGPVVLSTISFVLILAGGGLITATARLTGGPAAANSALVDAAATREVTSDVSAEVSQVFSYSYTDLPATRQAAATVLTGQALRQYNQLFSVITRNAAGQRLTVTTRVVRAGVTWLSGGQARVLVFLDQQAARGGTRSSQVGAQLLVTTQRVSAGHWLITRMDSR